MKESKDARDVTRTLNPEAATTSAIPRKGERASPYMARTVAARAEGQLPKSRALARRTRRMTRNDGEMLDRLKAMKVVASADGFFSTDENNEIDRVAKGAPYHATKEMLEELERFNGMNRDVREFLEGLRTKDKTTKQEWEEDAKKVASADEFVTSEQGKWNDARVYLHQREAYPYSYGLGSHITKRDMQRVVLVALEFPDKLGRLLVVCASQMRASSRASRQMRRVGSASAPPA